MHILLVLIAVPFLLIGTQVTGWLRTTIGADDIEQRRLSMLMLVAPLLALAIGLSGLKDLVSQVCSQSQQPIVAGAIVALIGMAVVAVASATFGAFRLWLLAHRMRRCTSPADKDLQQMTDNIAHRMRVRPVQLLIRTSDAPQAMTWGVWQPKLLLSTWMVRNLERDELCAVIAHELSHVARRDFLGALLATVLRDAFFYLPACRNAYQHIRRSNELATDTLAVRVTGQPLVLASALAKVWQHVIDPQGAVTAIAGTGEHAAMEARIVRLLAHADAGREGAQGAQQSGSRWQPVSKIVQWGLAGLFAINIAVMALPNGCLPLIAVCVA
ncbi:MAG: M56 family metallopeptidase [Chloroflexi bacterium]|nr:M56 family metallopeptidase [Chloroflexota bacterium]